MKAAWYPGQGKPIVINQLPDPEPGPGELLVRVHRCGICGTDLSMTKGEMWDFGEGQLGHEYSGEIVGLGKGVEHFRVGQKITANPSVACGTCASCQYDNNVLCRSAGSAMKGFAELITVPTSVAVPLPDTLSFADGALIEPLAISLYGVRHAGIVPGDRVLVLGGGTVALYAIYWARRLGAGKIVAMSRSARRADLCLAMGADQFIQYGENEVGEVIEALGGSPDRVFECAGAEGLLMKALSHVRPFGNVVSLGFCTGPDPVMPSIASYKCATLQFYVGYGMRDFFYCADQMDKGHTDPKAVLSCDISLDELPAMFQTLRGPNEETKVHVVI